MSNLQKCHLHALAISHVFYIRRTSVRSTFEEPLQQSAFPIRFTTQDYLRPLFGFFRREVRPCVRVLRFTLTVLIFRRSIEAT